MINSLTENEIRKLRQLLRTIPCNGVTTYAPGEGISITDTNCCNIKDINIAPLTFNFKTASQKVTFTKTNYGNQVDVIIPGVLEITRGNNQGIYNAAVEGSFNYNSPANTDWNSKYTDQDRHGWNNLENVNLRTYDNWQNSTDGYPAYMTEDKIEFVVHEITTDRYFLLKFFQWTKGNNGGGFKYERYEIYPSTTFTRPDYEETIVDKISAGLTIKRDSYGGGIYNSVYEQQYNDDSYLSPLYTEWNSFYTDPSLNGFSDLTNLRQRKYDTFRQALDGNVGNNIIGTDLIMHDLTTDLFWKFTFTQWTGGGNGGGLEYTRVLIPQDQHITFADGSVLSSASIPTSSGPVVDSQGNLIIADSSNNTVSVGAGASHDIPDFSGMLIVNDHYNGAVETWICGGGGTAVLLGNTPYGPGVGDVTINGNGYTWTNTNNQLGPFTFTVIKTRSGS
jgi:hypothetical protein